MMRLSFQGDIELPRKVLISLKTCDAFKVFVEARHVLTFTAIVA